MKDLKSPGENTSVFRTTMTGGNWICTKNYTKRPGKIRPILPSPISTAFIRIGSFLIHITLTVLTKNNWNKKSSPTSSVTGKRSRSGDLLPIGGICGTSSTKEKSWKTTTYGFQITEKSHTKTCFFWFRSFMQPTESLVFPWYSIIMFFTKKTRQAVISTIQPDWWSTI